MSKKDKKKSINNLLIITLGIVLLMTMNIKAELLDTPKLEIIKEIEIKRNTQDLIVDKDTFRPKVYVTKEGIEFLNKEGKVEKEYIFENKRVEVVKSKGAKYIGITTILESNSKGGIKDANFVMLDDNGNVKWEYKHKFFKCFPSPEGTYAIGMLDPEWGGAPLYLINSKGEEKQISEEGVDRSSSPHFNISENGNIITIKIKKLKENPDKSLLVVLDKKGNELWRKESENKSIGGLPSRKYIAVFTTNKETKECVLSMCDLKGNVLWEYKPFKGTGYVSFSEDLQYLFSTWELYEVETGKLVWRHEEYIKGGYIFATPNFEFIVVISGLWNKHKKTANTLYLFNREGKKLLYQEFAPDYIIFRDYRPIISISPDGKNILIETKEGLKIFKNPFTE